MRITLIGMSGTGKSYWSKKLEQIGFVRFGCDDLITEYLAKNFGFAKPGDFDMHAWVGYPDEEAHAERAHQYLQAEEAVLLNIIYFLEQSDPEQNIVIDSTGSIIYMKPEIIARLQKYTQFVYLDITSEDFGKMLSYYLSNPVAIIWNGFFLPQPDETRQKTFERCYPLLIESREKKYQELAQITIPSGVHKAQGTGLKEFLGYIDTHN